MTVHQFEDPVRTALERKMQVLTDVCTLRDGIDQFSGTVLGMRSHEAQPVIAVHAVDLRKKRSKAHRIGKRLSIGIDVLSE